MTHTKVYFSMRCVMKTLISHRYLLITVTHMERLQRDFKGINITLSFFINQHFYIFYRDKHFSLIFDAPFKQMIHIHFMILFYLHT